MFTEKESQRNILYNLCGALEDDFRYIIKNFILNQTDDFNEIVPIDIQKKAKFSINQENFFTLDSEDIVNHIPMGECLNIIKKNSKYLDKVLQKIFNKEFNELKSLVGIRNLTAHHRELKNLDLVAYKHFCEKYLPKHEIHFPKLNDIFKRILEDPTSIFERLFQLEDDLITHNLPNVEYFETGFIGRESYLKTLDKVIKSKNYPIITINGEGGVGKTAIALHFAYRILDDLSSYKFEQIHWETAKTKKLSSNEIINIANEIDDFKKMISSTEINLNKDSDAIDSVIDYLKNFKILLILDNIETVRDKFLEDFLEKFSLIQTESKVIFTSRQPFQQYEYAIRIEPFDTGEAKNYFRKLIKYWNVKKLEKLPINKIEEYCKRWNYNPLFIKSFIECIRDGQDPNIVLENKSNPLQFAFENMYANLKPESIPLVDVLLLKDKKRSASYLSIVSEKSHNEVIDALVDLDRKNFIEKTHSSSQEIDLYRLTNISREFLNKSHRIDTLDQEKYLKKEKEISIDLENERNTDEDDLYIYGSFLARNSEEALVKKILLQINPKTKKLRFWLSDGIEKEQIDQLRLEIETLFERAISLNPNYFEIYKAKALYHFTDRDYSKCNEAYETALIHNPDSTSVMYFYAMFLLEYFEETEKALNLLNKAYKLDPHPDIKLRLARVHTYLSNYKESDELLIELLNKIDDFKFILQRKIVHSFFDNAKRKAISFANKGEFDEFIRAFNQLKNNFVYYEKIKLVDIQTRYTILDKSLYDINQVISKTIRDKEIFNELQVLKEWVIQNSKENFNKIVQITDNQLDLPIGIVTTLFRNNEVCKIEENGDYKMSQTNKKTALGIIKDIKDQISFTFIPKNIPFGYIYDFELVGKKFKFKKEKLPNGKDIAILISEISE